MVDQALLTPLENRIESAQALLDGLHACFNALAQQQFNDPKLKGVIEATLQSNGLRDDMSIQTMLDALEPLYTKMILEEARLIVQGCEQGQRRMRLLMRSPRTINGLEEMGDDDRFAAFVPYVAHEITRLDIAEVPFGLQTSEAFLQAAATRPSAPSLKSVFAHVGQRRAAVVAEQAKLRHGMTLGEMSIADFERFYRGYRDMSFDAARDFAENTVQLCDTQATIAEITLGRLNLLVLQAYVILSRDEGRRAMAQDPRLQAELQTKIEEMSGSRDRAKLYLDGGHLTNGPLFGVRNYLDAARAYRFA